MTDKLTDALRAEGYITIQEADALLNCRGLARQVRQRLYARAGFKSIRLDLVKEADILRHPRYLREQAKRK